MTAREKLHPQYVAWPETSLGRGPVMNRMQSKEYRSFRFKGGTPDQWPGVEVLELPDEATARKYTKNGIPKNMLLALGGPAHQPSRGCSVGEQNVLGLRAPVSNLQYSSISSVYSNSTHNLDGTDDPYNDLEYPSAADAFARLPLDLLVDLEYRPHTRLFAVLVRHSAMRSRSRFKIRRKMWEEAKIGDRNMRRRAVDRLEQLGAIRVKRSPGQSPTVTLNVDRRGIPRLWEVSCNLKAVPSEEVED